MKRALKLLIGSLKKRCCVQEQEFKKIYKEFSRMLYNYILWLTHNRPACDDILQNVFINVWKCSTVPADRTELQRWLFTVSRNASMDYFRKVNRFSRFRTQYSQEYYDPPADPDARFTWNELSVLSENDRSIIYLHIKIGYTYKEIGELMEMTENLVRVKAFRALKKLRESIIKRDV